LKGRTFEWTNECQTAFEELKNRLVSSPILAHPDFSKKFILDTDASTEAIGAVLSQEIDGKERPIAFASRALTKPHVVPDFLCFPNLDQIHIVYLGCD
jgi:hypothetical protein